MKNLYSLGRNFLITLLLLTGINQTIFADPYIGLYFQYKWYYLTAAPKYGMCTNVNIENYEKNLYAVIPGGITSCSFSGTFQWYTLVNGMICVEINGKFYCYPGLVAEAIEGATSNMYKVTAEGLYWCTVDCGSGPYNTDTVQFFYDNNIPIINDNPEDEIICNGNNASFSLTAVSKYLQYQWYKEVPNSSYTSISGATSNSYSYTPPFEDNLSKFRCYVSNGCGGQYSDPANLTINPLPVIDIGDTAHICDGSDLVLDAGAGFTKYEWSTGENTRTITVNSENNYSVIVTDNNECSNSDNIQIYIDPKIPSLDLGNDKNICPGQSVQLDAGEDYDNYLWTTNATTRTMDISATGYYAIQVSINGNVCVEYDTIHVSVVEPFEDEEICILTVDPETEKIMVIFEKTPDAGIQFYNIYRQSDVFGVYDSIGSLFVDELSIFVDENSYPKEQQYLYKISTVDTCGTESELSNYHKTLRLLYDGSTGGIDLMWFPYEVEGVPVHFDSYIIYRGTDSTRLEVVKTISGDLNSWTDTDPVASSKRHYYRIAGVKSDVCDPANLSGKKVDSGPYSQSMSNIEDNRLEVGFNTLKDAGKLAIYPNPSVDFVTIGFPNPEQSEYQVIVRDLMGKAVLIINNITEDKVAIERGNLKAGYYSVEVSGQNIYRGKLIIE